MARTVVTRTLRLRRERRVTSGGESTIVPCPVCGRDVPAVTPVEAIRLLQAKEESFLELIAEGILHTIPTAAGTTWICRDSIFGR
jgi:hypothetical protein